MDPHSTRIVLIRVTVAIQMVVVIVMVVLMVEGRVSGPIQLDSLAIPA